MNLSRSLIRSSLLLSFFFASQVPGIGHAATMGIELDHNCSVSDTPGPKTVVVIQKFSYGTKAVRFKLAADPGMTMTYVSETHAYAQSIGNTQEGLSVCLDECEAGSIALATVTYMGQGTSQSCSAIRAVAHPDADTLDWVDCGGDPQKMDTFPIWIGPCSNCNDHRESESFEGDAEVFGCATVPTEQTTWGAIKALYR